MNLVIAPAEDAPAGMPLGPALRADLRDNSAEKEVAALTKARAATHPVDELTLVTPLATT